MTEIFLKFPLFYLVNVEIQSRKIQNNIYFLNFITSFYAEFPRSQDKREGISKIFLSFSALFLYMPPAGTRQVSRQKSSAPFMCFISSHLQTYLYKRIWMQPQAFQFSFPKVKKFMQFKGQIIRFGSQFKAGIFAISNNFITEFKLYFFHVYCFYSV